MHVHEYAYFYVCIFHAYLDPFVFQLQRRQSLSFGVFFLWHLLLLCLGSVGVWLKFFCRYEVDQFLIFNATNYLGNFFFLFIFVSLFCWLQPWLFNLMVLGMMHNVKKEASGIIFILLILFWCTSPFSLFLLILLHFHSYHTVKSARLHLLNIYQNPFLF